MRNEELGIFPSLPVNREEEEAKNPKSEIRNCREAGEDS
jgi:hypothetical protein